MYSPTTLAGKTSNEPQSQQEAPIIAQIQALKNSSERLHQALNTLIEKFAPVLGAIPEKPETKQAVSNFTGNSPVGLELCSINESVLAAVHRLQHASGAVEL